MGQLRTDVEFLKLFEAANKSYSLRDALSTISSFIGKPLYEEEVPTKYSETDGTPVETEWQPRGIWDGRLWLRSSLHGPFSLDKDKPLRKLIEDGMREGEVVLFHSLDAVAISADIKSAES